MIRWAYAFVDRPRPLLAAAGAFWAAVTGSRAEPFHEHLRLVRDDADPWIAVQGVHAGPGGAHVDLYVDDVAAVAARAEVVADHGEWCVLRSPGGFLFCAVPWQGEHRRPAPGASLVDQVCLDVSPSRYEAEVDFWAALTGWELRAFPPEFHRLVRPPGLPIHLLLQRTDDEQPPSAHLDLACADVAAERARHESLGATFVAEFPEWTVMRDPAGGVYCLTDRQPA
ncbi:VOC family protein [Symbioplanes lichenis]|uniref:VOC family protein n=1 Tax=Symbioplanes lichenis TaxID=1629072 RepID=UPI00273A257B|nr:VOC family protein [Actinoplanes lichenis]